MTTGSLWQGVVYDRVSDLLRENERVRALWLGGSLARGDADRLSDIDFVVAVDDHPFAETAAELEAQLSGEFDLVLLRSRGDQKFRLLNLVTFDWERLDFSLFAPAAIAESKLRGLRCLFDKDGIGGRLEEPPSAGLPPGTEQVDFTLTEFARILGLLPVVLHRDDLIGAVLGAGLLRELLVTLLKYDLEGKPARGALNETSRLTIEGADILRRLPPLAADQTSILEFHWACLALFLEHGPRIADRYQAQWPTRLIDALHARLAREFGTDAEIGVRGLIAGRGHATPRAPRAPMRTPRRRPHL